MTHARLVLLPVLALALLAAPAPADAAAHDEITAANEAGKTVFLLVTDAAAKNLEQARAIAKGAQERTPQSAIVELNRSDPKQATAVKKYRVAGAPVPLVLVIASNGVAAGGSYIQKGAVDRLCSLVPTPKKAEFLKVLSNKQTAVVVFSHAKMPLQSPLFEQLGAVVREAKGKVAYVLVDTTDEAEKRFVTEWQVDPKLEKPTLVVMNPKGQTLGRMTGAPKASVILETTKKRPCCSDPACKGNH